MGEKHLRHKNMQHIYSNVYNYSNVYPKGQPDTDNQRPAKWSSIVPAIYFNSEYNVKSRLKSEKSIIKMSQTEAATNFCSFLSSLHNKQDIKNLFE